MGLTKVEEVLVGTKSNWNYFLAIVTESEPRESIRQLNLIEP